jgi:hypothetical protein
MIETLKTSKDYFFLSLPKKRCTRHSNPVSDEHQGEGQVRSIVKACVYHIARQSFIM